MARIKVTRGGCGIQYIDDHGNARHALKTSESGPFECDDTQAARLVKLGVASYVNEPGWQQESDPAPQTGEQQEEQADGAQEPEKRKGHLDVAQFEDMTIEQMKNLAGDLGIDVSKCKKRADYIAAIVAVEVELGDEVDPDEDDMPELSAADPE